MKDSNWVYRLPLSKLVALGEVGVLGEVLDYMQLTHLKATGDQEARDYFLRTKLLTAK